MVESHAAWSSPVDGMPAGAGSSPAASAGADPSAPSPSWLFPALPPSTALPAGSRPDRSPPELDEPERAARTAPRVGRPRTSSRRPGGAPSESSTGWDRPVPASVSASSTPARSARRARAAAAPLRRGVTGRADGSTGSSGYPNGWPGGRVLRCLRDGITARVRSGARTRPVDHGDRGFEPLDAADQCVGRVAGGRAGQANDGDLEGDARVGRLAHLDQRCADTLQRSGQTARPDRGGEVCRPAGRLIRESGRGCPHRGEEGAAQGLDQRRCQHPGVTPRPDAGVDGDERGGSVGGSDRIEQLVDGGVVDEHAAGCGDLVERRQRVSRRTPSGPDDVVDGILTEVQAGVVDHEADMVGEHVGGQEVEVELLGARRDRGQELLGFGRRQHEHHVIRRLLEGLQQRVGRARREHVDLVEDVHLPRPRRAHRDTFEQGPHVGDAVVRRCVELLEPVDELASLDGKTVRAGRVGLAVDRVLAVEDLGQDASGRGLARPPRSREQVALADTVLTHGVAKRGRDVILAEHLVEAL